MPQTVVSILEKEIHDKIRELFENNDEQVNLNELIGMFEYLKSRAIKFKERTVMEKAYNERIR